jgi:acyl-CoA thioesterase-1
MGYTLPVKKLLTGVANLHRIPANGGPSKNVIHYDKWLGTGKWDLIHFNHGIHDLKHMPDGKRQVEPADYEANLRKIVARLKATGAKLIFATTTPIPKPPLKPERTFGEVPEYNAIALRVMKENGVPVDDLYTHMLPRFEELHNPQDLHYKPAGSQFLAEKVAAEIKAHLSEQK